MTIFIGQRTNQPIMRVQGEYRENPVAESLRKHKMNLTAIALLLVSLANSQSASDFELPPPGLALDKPVVVSTAPERANVDNVPANPAFAEEGSCDAKILALQDRIRQLDCEYEQSRSRELSRLKCLLGSLQEERHANELAMAERARQAELKAKQEAEERQIQELQLKAINEAKEREAEAIKIEMERAAQAEKMRILEQERREQEALAAAKRRQEEEALLLKQAEEQAKEEMKARRLEEEQAKLQREAELLQQRLREEERVRREAEALELKKAAEAKLQEAATLQSAAGALLAPKSTFADEEIIVAKKVEPKKSMSADLELDLLMQAQQLTGALSSLKDSIGAEPLPAAAAPQSRQDVSPSHHSAGSQKQSIFARLPPAPSPAKRPRAKKTKPNRFGTVPPPHRKRRARHAKI
jgi:DNA repair exonuclease SbcCD ATPase subunit